MNKNNSSKKTEGMILSFWFEIERRDGKGNSLDEKSIKRPRCGRIEKFRVT